MVFLRPRIAALFAFATLLSTSFASSSPASSPALAGPLTPDCAKGSRHIGTPTGRNVSFAGVPTYLSEPPFQQSKSKPDSTATKVILFFSDAFGPFYINNQLVQDYYAAQGYHVLGPDYFFGDAITQHVYENFQSFDPNFVLRAQAEAALPAWIEAVRQRYGAAAKINAVGYCFGAPYVFEATANEQVIAGAFAHPSDVTEDHFSQLKKPLLLSTAELDTSFTKPKLIRATDILAANKAMYHVQTFSGVSHGFATRGNMSIENEAWARTQSAKSVIEWFDRFSG
ncbi:dienelactone hydrolase family-domain-containing protein [Ephemerocybe angulata]|uniref:Dienelactone hydrolase family-domain-containing protein n=1 Tax=Ephemerocybe angulata TaxID=980116 RepID=A0A8H6H992_9AGAR|nr:dienelactone hydrolase family-domain-containing protein [Tulosesus angulatus]